MGLYGTKSDKAAAGGGGRYAQIKATQKEVPTPSVLRTEAEAPIDFSKVTVTKAPTLLDKYSKQIDRKMSSVTSGLLGGVSTLVSGFQWAADSAVSKSLTQTQKVALSTIETEQKAGKDTTRLEKALTDTGFPYQDYITKNKNLTGAAGKLQAWGDAFKASAGVTPENQTFVEKLAEGAGSSAVFFVPGIGVARGAAVLEAVSPRIALLFGNSTMTALEAMSEAGQVYSTVEKEHGEQAAIDAANSTFLVNAIVIGASNQLGIMSPAKLGLVKRALLSAPLEGLQESVQQITQNVNTGRPTMEGVVESGIIGAILGPFLGGAAGIVMGGSSPAANLVIPNKQRGGEEPPPVQQIPQVPATVVPSAVEQARTQVPQESAPTPTETSATVPVGLSVKIPEPDTRQIGQSKVDYEDGSGFGSGQRFSSVRSVPIEEVVKPSRIAQFFNQPDTVEQYKKSIAAGEPIDPIVIDEKGKINDGYHRLAALKEMGVTNIPVVFMEETLSRAQAAWEKEFPGHPFPMKDYLSDNPSSSFPEYTNAKPLAAKEGKFVPGYSVGEKVILGGKQYTIDYVIAGSDENLTKYGLIGTKGEALGTNESALDTGKEAAARGITDQAVMDEHNAAIGLTKKKTQKERVSEVLKEKAKSIKEVAEETGILEPNVRRILGVGAKEGTFERVAEGVYTIKVGDKDVAWIIPGDALEVLPKLAAEGFKADMVFLDIPYNAAGNKGGNRMNEKKGSLFETITPDQFGENIVDSINTILRTEESPVVYMYSQSKSSEKTMSAYTQKLIDAGYIPLAKGDYYKMSAKGTRLTMPMRPDPLPPEGIIIFNRTGKYDFKQKPDLQFKLVRPRGYQTEKPAELLDALIKMTTDEGDVVLDPFAGSGVTPTEAVRAGRKAVAIEKKPGQARVIAERVEKAVAGQGKKSRVGGGEVSASIGEYREGTPLDLNGANNLKMIELPEMVSLYRELTGLVPSIRQRVSRAFGGQARGIFIPEGKGMIRLRADLFDPKKHDPSQVVKTLAHEIGHLVDWLPNFTMKRGNLMGRLMTLRGFRDEFFAAAGVSRSNEDLRTEMWALSKFWRPLTKMEEVTDLETGKSEVIAVPAKEDEVSERFLAYRKSPKEIYADFISVIFNDPKLAADMAPTAYNLFFENLDKKPEVKAAYFEAQALLSGDRMELIKRRREGVQEMFQLGEAKALDLEKSRQAERQAMRSDIATAMKFSVIDVNYPMIARIKKMQADGIYISPDDNPVYYMEERNYLGGKIKATMNTVFNPVYQNLIKADVPWSIFGEELFYQRIIAGDRSTQANPRGITPEAAKELSDNLRSVLSTEQVAVLDKAMEDFRAGLHSVVEDAYKAGLFTKELYEQLAKNPAYVTFQVIEHLEATQSSKIHKSIGTLKDITNPADASLLKMIATIRATERNIVTEKAVEALRLMPGEVEDARSVFNGKNGVRFLAKKNEPETEPVIYYKNGKAVGVYVDRYIKMSIENSTIGENKVVTTILSATGIPTLNKFVFRPLFITYSVGFQAFNVVRDFKRFWKNQPTMTLARAVKLYGKAYPIARTRAFGPKTETVDGEEVLRGKWLRAAEQLNMLEMEKVLSVTYNDMVIGETLDDTQIDRIMRASGIESFQPKIRHGFMKPLMAIPDFIKKMGDLVETLPKAAGFYEFTDGNRPLTKEEASYIRRYIGSPDFLAKSYLKPVSNEIFLFSNAITQGIRADLEIATQPKTRGAFWWKTVKIEFIPKLMMMAAAAGLFGDELKKMFEDVSEYDKTNYTIIPLGRDSKGETIYFRMPSDESGRFLGGLVWKMFSAPQNEIGWTTDLSQLLSYTGGQVPGITPAISTPTKIFEYLQGRNPYDSFRGQPILSDDVFKAGGMYANSAMLKWTLNQIGGGVIMRFSTVSVTPEDTGTVESIINAPVVSNIVGRFIRVSNYGTKEHLTQIARNTASAEARTRLDKRALINDYVGQVHDGMRPSLAENRIVKEWFDGRLPQGEDERKEKNRLLASFRLALVKGDASAETEALLSATSNAQKLAILAELKSTMDRAEYVSYLQTLVREGVISSPLRDKAIKLK